MYSRTTPFHARITERTLLTGSSSSKKTFHIVLDIKGSTLPYKVGDSIGILPTNNPAEVEHILQAIQAKGSEIVVDTRGGNTPMSLRDFLLHKANLAKVGTPFLKLLPPNTDGTTLLELLQHPRPHPITPEDLARTLMPLLPRFYSIANSARMFPDELHLLVAYVHYHENGKEKRGVGSHFLCDLAHIDQTPIPLYLQPSNHFTLPQDPSTSIILIGPGTGIAPYRAFLQERLATQAEGRNWLFFGERNRATDFYYAPFWQDLEKQGRLRLNLAFSRDQKEKNYVQHQMYEERKSLWNWIQEGAHFYVCGDASKMAKDVDMMFQKIAHEEGNLTEEDARLFVKRVRAEKRYLTDVY